ncbi:MAG: efflux RND transporter periplasmic adaptor subunit [Phycisphaerae bacterium]
MSSDPENSGTAVEEPRRRSVTQGEPVNGAPLTASEKPKGRRRKWVLGIGLAVIALLGIAAFIWWLDARHYESTDDAFLDAHVVEVSPRISGHVLKVLVNDNQEVKAGDLLVELDPSMLDKQVQQAQANLDAAKAQANQAKTSIELTQKTAEAAKLQGQAGITVAQAAVQTAEAGIAQAEAQVTADEATAHKADLDLQRMQNLLKTGDVTQQQVDAAVAEEATAKARLAASRKGIASAKAQLDEAKAKLAQAQGQYAEVNVVPERTAVSERQYDSAASQIAQLQAALDQAKLDRSYATITAPADGRVTRRSVEPGQYVEKGQAMFALVPTNLYVTANFKETQLRDMKVGDPVEVKVDAYPGEELKGHVDSLQQGTGSRFSMLPPENATGNFVKVVQRVPVKIVFDEPLNNKKDYAPGMSVEPKVKVR